MAHILIDEGLTGYGRLSGIGHHMVNLAAHLGEITDCEISTYSLLRKIPRYFRKWAYIGTANIPCVYRKYDLVHHIANYVPFNRGMNKHVLTVHDLSIFYYPETISLAWRHYNAFSFRKSIQRADALIAVSKAVRDEVLNEFPDLRHERVYVCGPGIRNSIYNSQPAESDLTTLSIRPYSYFLFVGDLTRRKNLAFTLKAFMKAKTRGLIGEQTTFVVIGKKAWGFAEIRHMIESEPSVIAPGYLTDLQIAALYRFSKAFVYPSLYEGFGMPIVEAMLRGAPIILSKIPTSIELDNAHNRQMFCFDLGDEDKLIEHLHRLDVNFESVRAGLKYGDLSCYHYDAIAARHLQIYNEILER